MSRTYHSITTKYNIQFNGEQSYREGLEAINKGNVEDYSTLIPMYPISNHNNASIAQGNMDKTIEKSRKAIKLHSIKAKPKRNVKKANDPEYRAFYAQNEFNPALKKAWMLIGMSEFHKGDFLGAIGTFSYIAKHYEADKDIVEQCKLWIVRAYGEMGWLYEAEDALRKVNQDNLSRHSTGLLASVSADFLLKSKRYEEAIPYLELALKNEKSKTLHTRFTYLLAQLYQQTGKNSQAYDYYTKVIKKNPPYELDFNARMNRITLMAGNNAGVRKELNRMIRNSNNREYLDQLFTAVGDTYLLDGDTVKAIENYVVAADTSSRRGIEMALTQIKLGDLYYQQQRYVKAQPSYSQASTVLPHTHADYKRVSQLSENLGELVTEYDIVTLQDSLLHLSTLSREEQLAIINKIIEKVIEDEKRAEQESLFAQQNRDDGVELLQPIGMAGQSADWYFYNQNLMRSGRSSFVKQWGNRKLEDNWRRSNKAAAMFASNEFEEFEESVQTDSLGNVIDMTLPENQNPQYYLRQIPVTPEQKESANQAVASSLFAMGIIYKDKIEDIPMAEKTFDEFTRRFGTDRRVPDAYFQQYIMLIKGGKPAEANNYRMLLLNNYPESNYAKILFHEDYVERLERMYKEQDSIYSATYAAYSANDFAKVFNNTAYMRENYPLSALMPKFNFLNALSTGKTNTPEQFEQELTTLVEEYPTSDVSAMAKDILALMKQGLESQTGTSHGSLLARRGEADANLLSESEIKELQFSTDAQGKHRLLCIVSSENENINKLTYEVASYNFSRFMIKEFDLVSAPLTNDKNALSVTNFESYDEAAWYKQSITADLVLAKLFAENNVEFVIISEPNYGLLRQGFTLQAYHEFEPQILQPKPRETKELAKAEEVKITVVKIPEEKPVVKPSPATATETPKEEVAAATKIEKELMETTDEQTVTSLPQQLVTETVQQQPTTQSATQPQQTVVPTEEAVTPPVVQPEEPPVELYKNLFAYEPNKPHHIAIYILSGSIDFEKVKTAFDAYNAENHSSLNLNVNLESVGKQQFILVGNFPNDEATREYLIQMVKNRDLFEGVRGSNYRNLMGTQRNLNVMVQENALSTYFEFMAKYYKLE